MLEQKKKVTVNDVAPSAFPVADCTIAAMFSTLLIKEYTFLGTSGKVISTLVQSLGWQSEGGLPH